jgi:hypothetical protein
VGVISVEQAAQRWASMLTAAGVPVHDTPLPESPVTGACLVVQGPALTGADITGCGYVAADMTVTVVAAGLSASHVRDLYRLVDTVLDVIPGNHMQVTGVTPSTWAAGDQPTRPAYDITARTLLEA